MTSAKVNSNTWKVGDVFSVYFSGYLDRWTKSS